MPIEQQEPEDKHIPHIPPHNEPPDSSPPPATPHEDAETPETPALPPVEKPITRQERITRAQHYLEQKRKRNQRLAMLSTASPSLNGNDTGKSQTNGKHHADPDSGTTANSGPPLTEMAGMADMLMQPLQPDMRQRGKGRPSSGACKRAAIHQRSRTELSADKRRHKFLLRRFARKHIRGDRIQGNTSSRRFWLTALCTVGALIILILSVTGAGSYATFRFYQDTANTYHQQIISLRDLTPHDNLKIYDYQETMVAQIADQGIHTSVPLKQVSPDLINATVSTEDKSFWQNPGIDLFRILQAAIQDIQHGRVVQGGSTITQQLIKNLVVGNETNLIRKLQEIALTPEVNNRYSKADIMEMYLNTIYYGHQAYGIDAAATVYFGLADKPDKPASTQLDLAQSAMLAGMPSSPALYNPNVHPKTTFNRFSTVLNLMLRDGYITQPQAQEALQEAQQPNFFKGPPDMQDRAPHFTQYVLRQLEQQLHITRQQLSLSGLKVYTTLDIKLQDKIQKIMQEHIAELQGHNVSNAAEVLIDYHNGAIRSLLGSLDYNSQTIDGKFDVATMGYRQPGSSFKPYVYATALNQGITPAQAIEDAPLIITMPPGSNPATYEPHNYDQRYHGHVTLRCALQNSLNIPAVKALQHVGIQNALQTANRMGIDHTKGEAGYSLVLGGMDVNLLEHTTAFGAFANGGKHVQPYVIEKIVNTYNHRTPYTHQLQVGKQVLSPQVAYMMTDILSDNNSRLPEFFDCNPLQLYANAESQCWAGNRGMIRPAAAKTGTTNDFRDNWTMGYTSDFVMGVWAGNNDYSPMNNVTGVQGAAPIWHDAMLAAEIGHPIQNFVNPGGLARQEMTYPDGVRATDWYLPGHYPTFNPQSLIIKPTATTESMQHSEKPMKHETEPNVSAQPFCSNYSFAFPSPQSHSPTRGWW